MKTTLLALGLLTPAFAHRLDEYLQGTIISVERNRLEAQMTLTPGVAVFPALAALIDMDGNGVISPEEQRAYSEKVLRDLSLTLDGARLTPSLSTVRFSSLDEMKEGLGEIQLNFTADLPRGAPTRKLVIENHHQPQIAAYQINCLIPRDPNIKITAQNRNYTQSVYRLEFEQRDSRLAAWSGGLGWLGAIPLFLLTRLFFLLRRLRAVDA